LPITHEVVMKDHTKTVSALSIDPAGARVVSGSYDYDCKLWDFGGMNANFKPFRSFECKPGHQVLDVQFSITGDSFLAATGSTQVKLYDRDGAEKWEYNKGDMYIRDLRNTDGHVAAVTAVAWHPKDSSLFLTASADSSLRIWELDNRRKSKSVIVVRSKERGGKTKVTACAWSPDGRSIAAACEDGAVHVWSVNGNFSRPLLTREGAHEKGTVTSSIAYSPDGTQLATRGGDGTVKLWNAKSLKKPIATASALPSLNQETNVTFSPNGDYVLTGTAANELASAGGIGAGQLVVLSSHDLRVVKKIAISPFSVVRVLWHPKINQILTGSADGSIHVLYSPDSAIKGVTMAITKAPKARAIDDFGSDGAAHATIIAPHSLPMFKEDGAVGTSAGGRGTKRRREKERHDPQKTLKPMPPVVGPGRGGRIGAAATQHVVQNLLRNEMRDQDPREALLKYATQDPGENTWTKAWAASQPKPVFDTRPESDEEQ
ncbi:WD40 repeat-like protein, partial [Rhodotorula sp. JG-1b]